MAFKKVQYVEAGTIDPNAVSITPTGRINLNRHFVKRHGLQKEMGANLYWDEMGSKIAFAFTKKRSLGSFPLNFVPNGQAAYIIAIQYFRAHRLDPKKYAAPYNFEITTSRFLDISDEENDIFVIDLKQPIN